MGNQASDQGDDIRSDEHAGLGVRRLDNSNPTPPPRQSQDVVNQPRAGASDPRRCVADDSLSGHEPPVGKVAAKANQAGVELLKQSQHEEAVKQFKKALQYEPNSVQILKNIGLAYAKMQDFAVAYEWYEKACSQDTSDVESLFSLAWVERKRLRYAQAEEFFHKVLDLQPEHGKALYLLGDILKTNHDYEGAARYFERYVKLESTDIDGQMSLAQCCEHIKQYQRAVQLYETVLHLHPNRTDVNFLLSISKRIAYGEVLESQGQVQQARQQYEQALCADPGNINAQLQLATSYRQDTSIERNFEEACKIFDRVLVSQPENVEALEGAAYCHRKLSNWDTAVQLYQLYLKTQPTGQRADIPLYYLGDILYQQHRHAECQHYLNMLVDSNCAPGLMKSALFTLARSYASLDENDHAEQYARRGLVLWPNHPHFLSILAIVQNHLASYDESISTLQQALQHCDSSEEQRGGSDMLRLEIRNWLAMAFERKGDYRIAMEHLDVALKQDPQHVSSIITKGLVQIGLKQLNLAEASFKQAISIEKNNALALVRLGYCKLAASDLQEASRLFQLALRQRFGTVALPQSMEGLAHVYLALCAMGQQDINTALMQLDEAKKSHKKIKEVCSSSRDAFARGECEGLVNELRNICDLDINTAQAWRLVHLMAKEIDMRDPKAGSPAVQSDSVDAPNQKPAQLAHKADLGPRIAPRETRAACGQAPITPLSVMAATTGLVVSSFAVPTPSDDHNRRQWGAPPVESQRCESRAPPAEAQTRDWAALTPENATSEHRRPWTSAAPELVQKPPLAQSGGALRLELREQIDAKELTQEECLGIGGFGAVYRGYWKGQEVAIKKLFCESGENISPLQFEELDKEVEALRKLDHPRLLKFIGASLQPPNLCIVTEYMAGGSLHNLLHKTKTPLNRSQQNRIALQVAEGVKFLHGQLPPVVHRDLKSLNIVLDRRYNAKICDFGMTQSMERTHISLKEGGIEGSVRYMAPEYYDSNGRITEKVDVWAVGCLLVEIFGGPLPYDDCTNQPQIICKLMIEKEAPYIPNNLPLGLRPIIENCFEFDVSKRTTSQDVLTCLLQLDLLEVGVRRSTR